MNPLKIVLIGAGGTLGRALAATLESRQHQVLAASRRGALAVDLAEPASMAAFCARLPEIDAIVCCAAGVALAPLPALSDGVLRCLLQAKLFGQIALLQQAETRLRDGGSVTLTAGRFDGVLSGGAAGALANAGLEAFVAQAGPALPRGLRANVVSPGWVQETVEALALHGLRGTPAARVAEAYVQSIEGALNGQVLRP
jgi:NAD(P)-dependent dehydrogenase (short-subunit alcohol dehydrogenase family)